eukprot:TRINITY_DN13809_c0_g1_i1.p1 TRINITY_DN13809_c0_g1~~TRINITY_DN13809_c0_g1_i1.p1  ORF type:complete len:172 (+),score=12.84 TRINITY_DN13809_c0_g1_i1:101-616(+)
MKEKDSEAKTCLISASAVFMLAIDIKLKTTAIHDAYGIRNMRPASPAIIAIKVEYSYVLSSTVIAFLMSTTTILSGRRGSRFVLIASGNQHTKKAITVEDNTYEYSTLIAMIAGLAGLMLRIPYASWIAVVFSLMSIANMKTADADIKQVFASLSFSFMGLFINYFGAAKT